MGQDQYQVSTQAAVARLSLEVGRGSCKADGILPFCEHCRKCESIFWNSQSQGVEVKSSMSPRAAFAGVAPFGTLHDIRITAPCFVIPTAVGVAGAWRQDFEQSSPSKSTAGIKGVVARQVTSRIASVFSIGASHDAKRGPTPCQHLYHRPWRGRTMVLVSYDLRLTPAFQL